MTPVPTPLHPVSAHPGLSLDGAVWDAMLETAGPQDAVWLVRHIGADLNRMQDGLGEALAKGDAAALRRVSHALMGLGGTIGASQLHHAAQRLTEAARQEDRAEVATLGAEVLTSLDVLQALVAQRLSAMGTT